LLETKSGEYGEWSNFFINFVVRKLPDIECVMSRATVILQDPSIRTKFRSMLTAALCNLADISIGNIGLLVSV